MFKILIAEDDRELRQLFAHVLTKNGYTVLGVSNGEEALAALEQSYYDLIISDIMMPKMDGYELVRSIRESGSSIPIMMITAKDAFDDMRLGFLSGSDDYMVKPINIGEMVLRVSALLRRAQMASERRQVIGGTVMECDSLSVTVDGESMVLPQKEFMLLYKMASFPGRIFTRQQLMDDIWAMIPAPTPTPSMSTSRACASASATIPTSRSSRCAAWDIRWCAHEKAAQQILRYPRAVFLHLHGGLYRRGAARRARGLGT